MKKIFAILALAVTSAAFAQPKVTISGNIDSGVSRINSQDNTADKQELLGNGSSTSLIAIQGTEDLGNGLKAAFKGQHLFSATSGQTGNGTTASSTNNFFNDEIWVGLESKQYGAVKLGAPSAGLYETIATKSSPFGTALGGGYSSTGINRLLGSTTTLGVNQFVGGAAANGRVIRSEKAVRYDTPVFYGFSGNFTSALQNDNSTTATSNSNRFTDATVNYRKGPFNAAYSQAKVEAGANAAQGNNAASALIANSEVKYQALAANYTVGDATVYYGQTTGRTAGLASDKEVKSQNIAVKYAVTPRVDVLANYVEVKDQSASSAKDQDLRAISAIYKFSAHTSTYATYQKYDTDKSSATAGAVTQYMVGLRHRF